MGVLKIEIEPCTLQFRQPAGTSRGVYTTRKLWYVHLTDERSGKKATGECAPLPNLSCDDVPNYEEKLRAFADEMESTGEIPYQKMCDYPSMLFGLESAQMHLRAQKGYKLSDTEFANGKRGIRINGLIWMGTYEEMRQRLESKLSSGYHCIKIKIGAIDFGQELKLLQRIRTDFTEQDLELRVDANGAFAPSEAMSKLEQLAKYGIHSIEQPIRAGQWDEMAKLCAQTPIDIALDEELIGINTREGKEEMLDAIKPQYIILKPSLHGGFCGADEWIAMAEKRGMRWWATSALESNIGLNAIAHWCAEKQENDARLMGMPQGLGTGQLFTTNTECGLSIREDKLWFTPPT